MRYGIGLKVLFKNAIESIGLNEVMPGDGAFYGPKLDFVLTDAIERMAMWNFSSRL